MSRFDWDLAYALVAQETGWTYDQIADMTRSRFWSYMKQRSKLGGGRAARGL